MTDLVVRTVPGDPHGYCTVTTTWRPARPGDTPGELVPEHGPTQPVDLATRSGLDPTVPGDQLARHGAVAGAAPTTTEGATR